MERREAVKILAERHGITRVDEVYEDGDERRVDAPDPECWFEVDDETEGLTLLTSAASAGHAECVRLLLHYGAAPDLEDEIDETPLEAAEETGQEECAMLIRESIR